MGPHLRGPGLPRHVSWSEQQVWGRREAPSSRGLPPCCLGGTTSSWSMKSVGVGWLVCWVIEAVEMVAAVEMVNPVEIVEEG